MAMEETKMIRKLSDKLKRLDIPHVMTNGGILFKTVVTSRMFNGFFFTNHEYEKVWSKADVICKPGSYGYEENQFEIRGVDLMTPKECAIDDVVGFLTLDEVVERIVKAWKTYKARG